MKQTTDKIIINELVIPCIIGVFEHERKEKQNVILTIELAIDTQKAGKTDNLEDTVSYSDIAHEITEMVSNSQFKLLEKFADEVAIICLKDKRIKQVKVHVEKPKALKQAASAAIEIIRDNE